MFRVSAFFKEAAFIILISASGLDGGADFLLGMPHHEIVNHVGIGFNEGSSKEIN